MLHGHVPQVDDLLSCCCAWIVLDRAGPQVMSQVPDCTNTLALVWGEVQPGARVPANH